MFGPAGEARNSKLRRLSRLAGLLLLQPAIEDAGLWPCCRINEQQIGGEYGAVHAKVSH
jgi:hypothetical protein